jgi:hypothetical protein
MAPERLEGRRRLESPTVGFGQRLLELPAEQAGGPPRRNAHGGRRGVRRPLGPTGIGQARPTRVTRQDQAKPAGYPPPVRTYVRVREDSPQYPSRSEKAKR